MMNQLDIELTIINNIKYALFYFLGVIFYLLIN